MDRRTYIVSHYRGGRTSWEAFNNEAAAKAEYKRLLTIAEDQSEPPLTLISLSAVMDSSYYDTHPAFENKSAAMFSDALNKYIEEQVVLILNRK